MEAIKYLELGMRMIVKI